MTQSGALDTGLLFTETARALWSIQVALCVAFVMAFWGLAARLPHPLMQALSRFWLMRLLVSIVVGSYWWFDLYGSAWVYPSQFLLGALCAASMYAAHVLATVAADRERMPGRGFPWVTVGTGVLLVLIHAANVHVFHESQYVSVLAGRTAFFAPYLLLAIMLRRFHRAIPGAGPRLLPLAVGVTGLVALALPDTVLRLLAIDAPMSGTRSLLALAVTMLGSLVFGIGSLLAALEVERETVRANAERLRHAVLQAMEAERLQGLGQLASGVAHDFNNVLSVILGGVDVALYEMRRDTTTARRELQALQVAAKRGAALTQRLLQFARRRPGTVQRFDPVQITRELLPVLERLLHNGVYLQSDVGPSTCVQGDPSQFEQIILNLVVNARDAMPAGGRIRLSLTPVVVDAPRALARGNLIAGPWVRLTVDDEGMGIPPDRLAVIFDPFFTTKEHGGTGIGLSTVTAILSEIGGAMHVESIVGMGTRFSVYLPECEMDGALAPSRQTTVLAR